MGIFICALFLDVGLYKFWPLGSGSLMQWITVGPEQRVLAATVSPHRGEGHPDTLRSSCTSSSTTQKL